LEEKQIQPKNYLVDMRIINDLDGPENLYFYLKENGKLTNFYFMTGHLSKHDLEVIERTGAKVILKPFGIEQIKEIVNI
jgi:hypothetical protein